MSVTLAVDWRPCSAGDRGSAGHSSSIAYINCVDSVHSVDNFGKIERPQLVWSMLITGFRA